MYNESNGVWKTEQKLNTQQNQTNEQKKNKTLLRKRRDRQGDMWLYVNRTW